MLNRKSESDGYLLSWFQSNYRDIDRRYGTMDDVDRLISELKQRNMKLIMDLVVNHTSDQVKVSILIHIFTHLLLSGRLILFGIASLVH